MSNQEEISFRRVQLDEYDKNIAMYQQILANADPSNLTTIEWAQVSLDTEIIERKKTLAILQALQNN